MSELPNLKLIKDYYKVYIEIVMTKSDIGELHFITYIDNVPPIIRRGILSRTKARRQRVIRRDISATGVQQLRSGKKIPGTNYELHDYANLYFDAHNPMLSARRSENYEICVLRVEKSVLDFEGVIVTDKNAARECWFKPVNEGLPLLDANEVYAEFWLSDDFFEQNRLKGVKCAEVLVLDCVAPSYIFGAYVANEIALARFNGISALPVEINSELFF